MLQTAPAKSSSLPRRHVDNTANAPPKWKTSVIKQEDHDVAFHHLDDYLRGQASQAVRASQHQSLNDGKQASEAEFTQLMPPVFRASVLIASADAQPADDAAKILRDSAFIVHI